jgi:pyrimidine deaminase RibD-like protein
MAKKGTPTISPAGHSGPSKVSAAAARLGPLLVKIRDSLRESIDFLCGRRQALGPFTADTTGNNLPIILLDNADIATATLYLLDLDLGPDAVRLDAMAHGCRMQSAQESLGITAEGLSEEERDCWTELFGSLPDCSNPDDVANRRTMLIGRCSQFLEHVEELIGTVDGMFPADRGPAAPGAKAEHGEGNDHDLDRKFMERAVEEARKSRTEDSRVHPKVGVVIVKDGKELAVAYRGELSQGDHAEFTAMEKKLADVEIAGATVYTTLEPCTSRNHPKVPCAVRLNERKVKRVVIGMHDPNPKITGKGFQKLREANITVDVFPPDLMSKIEEMNREFIRHHKNPPMSWIRRFIVWLWAWL